MEMTQQETMDAIKNLSPSQFKTLYESLSSDQEQAFVLVERCKTDVELFTMVFFPHYAQHNFNDFHRDCFKDWETITRKTRRAYAAPRGSAKSTLQALIKPIHDVCYGLERYIVVISNTEAQASAKLKDIRRELMENPILRAYFGEFFSSKKVSETMFVASCNGHQCMYQAFSAGTEMRGIRFGASRPSKIICDDVEHSDEVYNEEIRRKYSDWFREVVSQVGDENTNIEFIGTVLHKKSLLIELTENPAYTSKMYKSVISWSQSEKLWGKWRKIYGDLDNPNRLEESQKFFDENQTEMLKGTQVLWPEKENYLDLMKIQFEIGRKAFMKERQNEPVASDQAIFDTMHFFTEVSEGLRITASGVVIPWKELTPYGVLDPSTGQTKARAGKAGDFSCLLSGYQDYKGRLFVHSDWTRRASPTKFIEALFEHHDIYNYSKFGVETNLYRNLLLPNIDTERKLREQRRKQEGKKPWGINLPLYDIENVDNKEKRIYTLEPKVTNGFILFNETLSNEFKSQIESFPLGEHDDCPDALEMLWSLVNNRFRMSGIALSPQQGR